MYTLNCKGKLLAISQPLVMGILNATPDSFYEGHLPGGLQSMVKLAEKMMGEGAEILDIGGQSTRPGSERISAEEEMKRVLPLIEALAAQHPQYILSIDTYYSEVALAAVNAGASIVNDISAGNMNAAMLETVGALNVPYVCMHMPGELGYMQQLAHYDDVVKEVLDYFIIKIAACTKAGIKDVIVDPGFGFGKTIAHNFTLLNNLAVFEMLDRPVLVGLSRKGTVYKTLGITAREALNGTTVLNTLALKNGASILRVHDVKEAREAVQLIQKYSEGLR